ncbi:MAG: glutamate racemase [Candidatus Daviesbacteria bacterium]|nr:glutamate racemase [Candidatus Daviesbacteria bacterium]
MNKNSPIGIFDSGVGGLTVVKEILQELPHESLIYLGDTARVPYGTRGKEVITKFALEMANYLLKHNVKILVVACNTISATCLNEIQTLSSVPVLGVIDSAVDEALKATKIKHIGVIGTRATISSGVYEDKIKKIDSQIKVSSASCPLLVPLVEEGFTSCLATKLIVQDYLNKLPLKDIDPDSIGIDTLILGCTHYPLLQDIIQDVAGQKITLIDSAKPLAKNLRKILEEKNLLRENKKPNYEFYITDAPERAKEIAENFFGKKLPGEFKKIDLEC